MANQPRIIAGINRDLVGLVHTETSVKAPSIERKGPAVAAECTAAFIAENKSSSLIETPIQVITTTETKRNWRTTVWSTVDSDKGLPSIWIRETERGCSCRTISLTESLIRTMSERILNPPETDPAMPPIAVIKRTRTVKIGIQSPVIVAGKPVVDIAELATKKEERKFS